MNYTPQEFKNKIDLRQKEIEKYQSSKSDVDRVYVATLQRQIREIQANEFAQKIRNKN